jgi:D-alanyl-D-alanine carboxypeptidase
MHISNYQPSFEKKFKMRKLSLKISIASFIIILSSTKINAQNTPSNIANSFQNILDNALPVGLPNSGVVMTVTIPGQWSWSGSSGYALSGMNPLYPETMATPSTKFRVGSITKTFVAVCIMKLEEAGLLSIEDPIDNYLRSSLVNDTIMSSGTVKIRHLLNHTSGIANSANNQTCQADVLNNPLTAYTYEDAIYCGTSQGEIFPPEFAWAYSNTNYSILAMIIEEVSGVSYSDYVTEHIFTPFALQHTGIPLNPELSGDYMGCYWDIGSWIDLSIIHPSIYRGWADIVSNTEDLNSFYINI